jgi:hypothetical protein
MGLGGFVLDDLVNEENDPFATFKYGVAADHYRFSARNDGRAQIWGTSHHKVLRPQPVSGKASVCSIWIDGIRRRGGSAERARRQGDGA